MEISEILQSVSANEAGARARLIESAYQELRRIAQGQMSRERDNHTLSATALANEVSIRLLKEGRLSIENRGQFFSYVARAMRNHLVDHARAKGCQSRGGDRGKLSLDESMAADKRRNEDVLELNEALQTLAQSNPRVAQVVEMKYFGGLSNAEIAYALEISIATVKRDWDTAKQWLQGQLK